MKKIIIYFFVIFLAAALMAPAQNAYAEVLGQEGAIKSGETKVEGAEKTDQPLLDYTFKLEDTLKAEGQKQEYLWGKEGKGTGKSPVIALIMKIINIMIYTIGSAALVVLVVCGLWLVTSHGEQSQIEKGKKIFLYALVGLGFALGSYIIVTFVQSLLT
ncbi:hypothetical protein HZA39_00555 [Candidatus Peregrinibacteria bacterium]|nr:hypothetical protein [Candidatus Peregrinibacteria bacterium]